LIKEKQIHTKRIRNLLDPIFVIPLLIIGLVIETSLILSMVFVILKLKELFRRLKE